MKYLLLHAVPDDELTGPGADAAPTEWITEMSRRDLTRGGHRLRPAAEATTVRVRDGETLVTHGPYAEVQEQVAGYDLIEAADLDEALEVASRHPTALRGAVEVRPLWLQ